MATEGVEGCAHAQPEVAQYSPSGAFSPEVGYRKWGHFPAHFSSGSTKCWLDVLYDFRVYPFPMLSAPFIFIITYKVCCFRICCVVLQEEEEEEEEVSLGVIMTNTEIKFHILLFTVSSSSVSQSLSFNLLQSLYCPLSSILALCLQVKVWSFLVLSIRKDSGSLFSS